MANVPNNAAEDAVLHRDEQDALAKSQMEERLAKRAEFEKQKIDWRNRIAAETDAEIAASDERQFGSSRQNPPPVEDETPVIDEPPVIEDEIVPLEEETPVINEEPTSIDEDDLDGDQLITRVIDGERVTKPLSEWLQYTPPQQEPVVQEQTPPPAPFDEEAFLRDIGEKIQVGTPEERTEALRGLAQYEALKARQQAEATAAQAAYSDWLGKYPDIAKDKILLAVAHEIDRQTVASGKVFDKTNRLEDFRKRLVYVAQEVRKWKKQQDVNNTNENDRKRLQEKKAKIRNLKNLNVQPTQESKALNESEANQMAIKDMFGSRRKRAF